MIAQDQNAMADGLLKNGLDSIQHALEHFSNRSQEKEQTNHDDKWIVLSVYHAAECVCNALLLRVEPNCSLFYRGGAEWYPSLTKSLERLKLDSNQQHLTPAERQLLLLISLLPDIRHKFMHRTAPKEVDVSVAAMCLIGILKHLEARYQIQTSDLVLQYPPIESDVVAAIRYKKIEEYGKFIELFLNEKYRGATLQQCPSCAAWSVMHFHCEACFEELEYIRCPNCDENVFFLPLDRVIGTETVECQFCGFKIDISD